MESKISYDSFHFDLGLPEIDEQADTMSGGLEIIEALRHMNFVEGFHRFKLDDDAALHQKIGIIVADNLCSPHHGNRVLLKHNQTRALQLNAQGVFIHFLQEAAAHGVGDGVSATDNFLGHFIQSAFICPSAVPS